MPGPIAKPQMRRMHIEQVKRILYGAVASCFVGGVLFKVFFMDARRKIYDEFWATYDSAAAIERQNRSGYMRSAPQNLNK